MKSKIKLYWIPVLLLLALVIGIFRNDYIDIENIEAKEGKVSLQNLKDNNIIGLTGEWQYYPGIMIKDLDKSVSGQLVRVPHIFENKPKEGDNPYGVGSYRLYMTDLNPNEHYGIQIINIPSAYRITINGDEILKAGRVDYTKEGHIPEMKEKIGGFNPDDEGNAEFLIEISNFSYNYGGFWRKAIIGQAATISHIGLHQDMLEIFQFSSITLLGLFLLGLFTVSPKFRPMLYFSLICLVIGLRTLFTNNRQFYDFIANIPWDIGIRLEFLSGYLLLPLFVLFFNSLEYTKNLKFLTKICYMFMALSFSIMIFSPNKIYANLLLPYVYLCTFSILYLGYVLAQGLRRRKSGSLMIFIGSTGIIVTTLIDFYGNMNYYLLPLGTFFMLIFLCIVVIKNYLKVISEHGFLEDVVMKDPLTGLRNRYFLNDLMDKGVSVTEGRRLYLLFFDLDKFKYINDNYGHSIGDDILKESARRISECFHRETDITCRYGGDEFIAIVWVSDQVGSIELIVDRVLQSFKEPFIIHDKEFNVSVSIGISEYKNGDDLERKIKESDDAMYEAKKSNSSGILIKEGAWRLT